MSKRIGTILYWVGVAIALPFLLLIGVSIMRIFSEGFEAKYVSSTFLGIFGAAFSYAVGYLLRHILTQENL